MSEKTIQQIIRSTRTSLYQDAAKKFNTSYVYVVQIAAGKRKALRGKGLEIKTWMLEQVKDK